MPGRSRSLVAALAATCAVAGCGAPVMPEGVEARARGIVWDAVYAAPEAPPTVEWREDDCGGADPGVRYGARCYAGLYLRDDRALVAFRGPIHRSAYAHELMHALQWFRGIEDPDHLRPEWTLVDRANVALASDGL